MPCKLQAGYHVSAATSSGAWFTGQICIGGEGAFNELQSIDGLQCTSSSPSTGYLQGHGSKNTDHQGSAAGEGNAALRSGGCGAGCLGPRQLVLSWRMPPGCARCEVWGRLICDPNLDPVPKSTTRVSTAAAARTMASSSRRALRDHGDPVGTAGPSEDSLEPGQVGGHQGASEAEADLDAQPAGWVWLGTAHVPRFWVAGVLSGGLGLGLHGVELAVQACDNAGRPVPLEECPRVRAPRGCLPAALLE